MKPFDFTITSESLVGFLRLLKQYGFTNVTYDPPEKDPYSGARTVKVYATGTDEMYQNVMEEMNR